MGKRIQRVDIDKMNTKLLELGYQDENIHTQVQIDCSSVLWDYPDATAKMTVQAPNGEKYPVVPELTDNVVVWDVTDSDLVYAGSGKIQLTLKNGTEVIKSASCGTRIMESITATGPAPTPLENWMQRAEETAEQIAETAAETVLEDYGQVKEDVTGLKSALYQIREPGENLGYVTAFSGNRYGGNIYAKYVSKSKIAVWGTANAWVRMNLLRGNDEMIAGTPTLTNNIPAGTYTLKADDTLWVYYGDVWANRTMWNSGETITIGSGYCVWLSVTSNSQSFGTESNPTVFGFEIYAGNVSTTPTAIDAVARSEITNKIGNVSFSNVVANADFDYEKPYNIFNGTTFTPGKHVDYLTGNLKDDTSGKLATDYMEIDNTKGYLCLNISVQLSGETGEGLVTGANRVWAYNAWAFYDENKTYIRTNTTVSEQQANSKTIPTNAKYVRLTVWNEAIIPYIVLFYGNFTSGQYVRYREYRKEIKQSSVYADTGMDKLNMVMFGDSITFGYDIGNTSISYIDFANDYLRGNIINVGLGGSRMSQGDPAGIGLGSFASLCENITSDDATAWDALESWCTSTSRTDWLYQIAKLKSVDWSSVQAVGLWYGANDWHNNVPVGTDYNETTTNYDGACAYGLKKLLTKYPHLQVIIFTPLFRVINETHTGDDPNTAGLTISDYGASLKNVQTVFHCPVVDACNELGINRYTIYTYSATYDGTHPRKLKGAERIGRFFAESIKRFVQPY